jgi:hypothetical protein
MWDTRNLSERREVSENFAGKPKEKRLFAICRCRWGILLKWT